MKPCKYCGQVGTHHEACASGINAEYAAIFEDDEEHALARNTDPDTSHDAAETVDVTERQRLILEILTKYRKEYTPVGMTSSEIADRGSLPRDSVSPRMKPLRDKDKVIDTGAVRKWDSGRNQIVWDLKPEEPEVIEVVPVSDAPINKPLQTLVGETLSLFDSLEKQWQK